MRASTHPTDSLPKFLGGAVKQLLSKIKPAVHTEFHRLLGQELKAAGFPLPVGGVKGSTKLWSEYFAKNPGSQQAAFDVVIRVSETIDAKHGTSITEDLLENIVMQRFKPQL